MLMMRVTPNISESPAPTRNRLDAEASPLSAWKRTASRLMRSRHRRDRYEFRRVFVGATHASPDRGEACLAPTHPGDFQFIAAAGRSFRTSSSLGCTLAPSTYLKSFMVPLPAFSVILPTYAPMVA